MPRSSSASSSPSVSIFGGGVAGLSVAQELCERGFRVTVYEKQHWGGKVRGMPVPGSGTEGRKDLPGQHGFHFFPGFYRNLPDLMSRIPSLGGKTVKQHIVWGDDELLARVPGLGRETIIPAHFSPTLKWVIDSWRAILRLQDGIPLDQFVFFITRALAYAMTCRERRVTELDEVSWWDYVQADQMSPEYQRLIANLPTSLLIAVPADVASSRTLGDAMIQMLADGIRPGQTIDRLLDGPEEDLWVQPWVAHLAKLGAELHMPAQLDSFEFDGRRIIGATVTEGGVQRRVVSDYYVCALPLDVAQKKITPAIKRAAPSLARIDELKTGWMNGVQLFLRRQVPLVRGHVGYEDAPWALTSVSQGQFWPDFDWSHYGDGTVREVFSLIISDWDTPGTFVKKPAKICSKEEIYEEVLGQVNAHIAKLGDHIAPADVATWFIDPDIVFPRGEPMHHDNQEKLYITTCGAWSARADACTEIPNFFLAGEWLHNYMDFASAEGTNETSRRAVNGILDAARSKSQRCKVYPQHEPLLFAPMRLFDTLLYKLNLPALGFWGATPLTPPVPFK